MGEQIAELAAEIERLRHRIVQADIHLANGSLIAAHDELRAALAEASLIPNPETYGGEMFNIGRQLLAAIKAARAFPR